MEDGNDEKDRRYISSLPEFAEIFLFLQIFGPLMKLRSVTLKALEDFFINGKLLVWGSIFFTKAKDGLFSPRF